MNTPAHFTPSSLGKYVLLNKIAVGGMAELYLAKITGEKGFEKLLAVKKLLPHIAVDEDVLHCFVDEAKLAAFLQHRNIVQIYDFGRLEQSYFIAMEYLFGKDFRAVTNKAQEKSFTLPLSNALYVTSRICDALDYAHQLKDFQGKPLNIIHRDISPPNIFVTYGGQVKIVDFGIAKAAGRRSTTQVGVIKGKAAYMSPEQAEGKPIDHRTDIFSSGILLYEMVTRRRMFEGDTAEILAKVRNADFVPPETLVEDLPDEVHRILDRALAKAPEDRYQTAGEMFADLEQAMAQLQCLSSDHGIAQTMSSLFAEEIEKEEAGLRRATRTPTPQILHGAEGGTREVTENLVPDNQRRLKKTLLYWTSALAFLFISTVMAWRFGGAPTRLPPNQANPTVSAFSASEPLDEPGRDQFNLTQTGDPEPAGDPSEPPRGPHVRKALQALREGRHAEAAALFDAGLRESPDAAKNVVPRYCLALRERAAEIAAEDPSGAEALLVKALELEPDSIRTRSRLAKLYVDQERFEKAIEAYMDVLDLGREFPETFFNLGYTYARSGDYERAKAMFSKAVSMEPPFLDEALFNLAIVEEKLGDRENCLAHLREALAANPENEAVRRQFEKVKANEGAVQ